MFENNKAIDTRFLKVKLEGKLVEKFGKDFNMKSTAINNRMYYIKLAKHLMWLQEAKQQNLYSRRYETDNILKGRRRQIMSDITWLIDMYSEDVDTYNFLTNELDNSIFSYRTMINELKDDSLTKWKDTRDRAYHNER